MGQSFGGKIFRSNVLKPSEPVGTLALFLVRNQRHLVIIISEPFKKKKKSPVTSCSTALKSKLIVRLAKYRWLKKVF